MTRILTGLFSLLILCTVALLQSCEIAGDVTLDAENLTVTMAENQEAGASIGQIKATSDGAALNFEVLSSTPDGAFDINPLTGLLTIEEPDLFDFETRTSLSAVVRVSADDKSEEVDILVNLEDTQAAIEDWNRFTKAWKTSAFTADSEVMNCRMDDQLVISGTGKYTYTTGTELCENEEMIWLESGTWDLDENLQFVLFDKGTESEFKTQLEVFESERLELNTNWNNKLIKAAYTIE